MRLKLISTEVSKGILLFLVIFSLISSMDPLMDLMAAEPSGSFLYEFRVDENGFATARITFISSQESGSSWVFVPKFSEWENNTVQGEVTKWFLRDVENLTGRDYYFYEALCFSFKSTGSQFEMTFQFNISNAAMIIEPDGLFLSPQIGIEKGNKLKAEVIFPLIYSIKSREAYTLGDSGSTYQPSSTNSNASYVLFDSIPKTENLMRIEVGFKTRNQTAEKWLLRNGIFSFEAVPRYTEYAHDILDLFNKTYSSLVNLFGMTLESVNVKFFLPDFNSVLTIGGYVPFSGEIMGDININIFFLRSVKGYIEIIALHELVHQFLWKAGISPQTFLWFHEGMAQYISVGIAEGLGYEGAKMEKEKIENGIQQLKQSVGENFGFLTTWSPSQLPTDIGAYYAAAYYVVSRLAESRGGFEYYTRFFKLVKGERVNNNAVVGYYLSQAANESVARLLNDWGFNIPDLYVFSPLLGNVKEVLDNVNPIYEPYKYLAELLYNQAWLNAREEDMTMMNLYLTVAILIARLAPLLTLITAAGVLFGAILLVLKAKGVFSDH